MKKLLIVICSCIISVAVHAQSMDNYYMKPMFKEADCVHYIGKRIIVFNYESGNPRNIGIRAFEEMSGSINTPYTIEKIKYGSKISMDLISDEGEKIKLKINNGGTPTRTEIPSCDIFFVLSDFEQDMMERMGTYYKNENNENVAILCNYIIDNKRFHNPILRYTLKSVFNDEMFICDASDAHEVCRLIGTNITHPRVKHAYKIIGAKNYFFDNYYSIRYLCQNTHTLEIKESSIDQDQLIYIFNDDTSGEYVSSLLKIEKPNNPAIAYGEITNIISPKGVPQYHYKDNIIDLIIYTDDYSFKICLENVSDSSIKIIWDDVIFVSYNGSIEKVMHKGVKYVDRNESQKPTTIIRNTRWEDVIIPTNLIYYSTNKYELLSTPLSDGGWYASSIYPSRRVGIANPNIGQMQLMIPIQINGIVNEYIFIFDVKYEYEYPERINLL